MSVDQVSLDAGDDVLAEVRRLGLEANLAELETLGLTVVPPDVLGNRHETERALERICDIVEQRSGVRPDATTGETHANVFFPTIYYFLFEDPVFQSLLLNEHALALVTHLLGKSCILNACTVFMKGPAELEDGKRLQLALHSDMQLHPEPFPHYAQHVNATWLLSDYTADNGALAFYPGSHRFCRHPRRDETQAPEAVPVEAPAGSLVLWHGNTWHGSFPRRNPGLRTGLAYDYVRAYIRPSEPYGDDVTDEVLAQHGPRFATLMGKDLPNGWRQEGPDPVRLYKARYHRLTD